MAVCRLYAYLVSVGTHDAGVGVADVPALVDNVDTDLVVGQVAVLLRRGTLEQWWGQDIVQGEQ